MFRNMADIITRAFDLEGFMVSVLVVHQSQTFFTFVLKFLESRKAIGAN